MDASKLIRFPEAPRSTPEVTPAEMLEDYVDHLVAPLVGLVPIHERRRLREETLDGLEARTHSNVQKGMDETEAAIRAIRQYGNTAEIGTRFLEAWLRHQPAGLLGRKLGLPNAYALIFFGQAALCAFLMMEYRLFFPAPVSSLSYVYGDMRKILPEPIPLPDASPLTLIFLVFVIVAPIVAGWLTGRLAILHAVRASYQILIVLILVSFALGVAMLPITEGLFLALTQMLWWLPAGCLSAHVAAALTWRKRCAYHSFPRRQNHDSTK